MRDNVRVRSRLTGTGGALVLAAGAAIMPGLGANATVNNASFSPPPFAMSGLPALTRGSSDRPAFEAPCFAGVRLSSSKHRPAVGPNVNLIGSDHGLQPAP